MMDGLETKTRDGYNITSIEAWEEPLLHARRAETSARATPDQFMLHTTFRSEGRRERLVFEGVLQFVVTPQLTVSCVSGHYFASGEPTVKLLLVNDRICWIDPGKPLCIVWVQLLVSLQAIV